MKEQGVFETMVVEDSANIVSDASGEDDFENRRRHHRRGCVLKSEKESEMY